MNRLILARIAAYTKHNRRLTWSSVILHFDMGRWSTCWVPATTAVKSRQAGLLISVLQLISTLYRQYFCSIATSNADTRSKKVREAISAILFCSQSIMPILFSCRYQNKSHIFKVQSKYVGRVLQWSCLCRHTYIYILCKSVCYDITVSELCRSRPYSVWLTKRHWELTVMPVIALLNNLKVWKTNTCDLKSTSFVFCYVLQFTAYYRTSLRGANKVLQLPTLIKKMVKINCWVMMIMYQLVINFRKMMKNDVPFTCMTSSWRHCKYKYFF